MTDPSPLTPEQDAVRRLLAEARHDGSAPPEVVARLDGTLASLVAERGARPLDDGTPAAGPTSADRAPVVDLAARRRRRVGVGLLAAAAVVVGGVAVGQVLPSRQGSGDSAGAGAERSTVLSEPQAESRDDSGADAGADSPTTQQELAPLTRRHPSDVPTVSTTDGQLAEDLADLRTVRSDSLGSAEARATCSWSGLGRGRRVVAEVDGQAGLVVFRRPAGDRQDVAIYVCGDPHPVRILTLPAP